MHPSDLLKLRQVCGDGPGLEELAFTSLSCPDQVETVSAERIIVVILANALWCFSKCNILLYCHLRPDFCDFQPRAFPVSPINAPLDTVSYRL